MATSNHLKLNRKQPVNTKRGRRVNIPRKDINDEQTNLTAPTTYQIKENTYLDKIIELRAYTDFLALFSDADNGGEMKSSLTWDKLVKYGWV